MDVPIDPQIERSVRDAVKTTMPDAMEFAVAVKSGGGSEEDVVMPLSKLLDWALGIRRTPIALTEPEARSTDFFFRFGRS
jgi:hypothetical protein